ncbi:fork head domain-containing protein crocodile-like [Sarcoptes scabiei]|nr:fork head domain-containing protein crocodile-like [Sarcoptes scabiei]
MLMIEMIFISCVFFLFFFFFAIIRFKTHINSGAKKKTNRKHYDRAKRKREREMEMEMENGSEECERQSFKMMDHTSHHYIGMKSNSILRSESIRKTHSTEQRYRKSNQDLTK